MSRSHWESIYREDWWVEFVEGEVEPNLRTDMQWALQNSARDLWQVESLRETRALVKEADDVAMPEDGRIDQRIHMAVMDTINAMEQPALKPEARRARFSWILSTLNRGED